MSQLKAKYDLDRAQALLQEQFASVEELTTLSGGEASQAFGFEASGKALVLRVNHHGNYARDHWAARKLSDTPVPVPAFVATGFHGEHHWAVSERAPGTMIADVGLEQARALVPQLIGLLDSIHSVDISRSRGYGHPGDDDLAPYNSWAERLAIAQWHPSPLLEGAADAAAVIHDCYYRAQRLISYLPEDRVLVHGDFGETNLLTSGGLVTGVIDWTNCLYGDPLWDVAWLDFWSPQLGFAAAYLEQHSLKHANERIRCYQLVIAGRALSFLVHTRQPEKLLRQVLKARALLDN